MTPSTGLRRILYTVYTGSIPPSRFRDHTEETVHLASRLAFSLVLCAVAAPLAAQSGSFGNSVVIGADELIIGEPNNFFRPGLVYVYRRNGDMWREAMRLQAPEPARADGFGAVLAASGNPLFVAQRGGGVHMFRRDGNTWRAA